MYIFKKTVNNTTGDNMICFFTFLVAVIVAVFFIPVKFVIYSNARGKNVYYVDKLQSKNDTTVVIKILRGYTYI